MKKYIIAFIAIGLFAACNKPNTDINQFKWLEGKWEGVEGEMQTYEQWDPIKDNSIEGSGGLFSGEDTLFSERIKIKIKDGELNYIAGVPGNADPVAFKLIISEKNSATFENLKNEFPQRVSFTQKMPEGSLLMSIDGKRAGKDSKQAFSFKRVN